MHKLDHEKYYGNIEYKQELSHMDSNKIEKYATQMKFRLLEGHGRAVYLIGVQDDGVIVGVTKELLKNYTNIMLQICKLIDSKIYNITFKKTSKTNYAIMIVRIKACFDLNTTFYLPGGDI